MVNGVARDINQGGRPSLAGVGAQSRRKRRFTSVDSGSDCRSSIENKMRKMGVVATSVAATGGEFVSL